MRGKIINVVVILVVFLIGVLGTLYFTSGKEESVQTTGSRSNVTIEETNTISTAVDKIYDAVIYVESYKYNQVVSSGSGFVYKKDSKYGYIMTNHHVVDGATKVSTINGDLVSATLLGSDSYADLAVLRIDADKVIDVASVGDSTKSKIGDTVFTVGTPIDSQYMGTVTKGILSNQARTITVSSNSGNYMMEVLQTDASINPGNSGGPLVNINGEVIGITSMKLVTNEVEGMGFAIPIEVAMAQVDKLESGKEIQRPYIGVVMYDVSNVALLYRNNIKLDKDATDGVVISEVQKGSSAAEAGLQANDVILSVDGTKVKNSAHFKYILYKHNIGDTVKLNVSRNGKELDVNLKLTKAQGNN